MSEDELWDYYSDLIEVESLLLYKNRKLKAYRISKDYLTDPYCPEVCLDMHASYDCVSAMQKWIEKMIDTNNALGQY